MFVCILYLRYIQYIECIQYIQYIQHIRAQAVHAAHTAQTLHIVFTGQTYMHTYVHVNTAHAENIAHADAVQTAHTAHTSCGERIGHLIYIHNIVFLSLSLSISLYMI